MSDYKKLRNKIAREHKTIQGLEDDLHGLEKEIIGAKAYVKGLEESLKLVPNEEANKKPASSLRPGGSIAQVHDILSKNGNPMHINDILTEMGRNTDADSKKTLTAPLNNYVRQGKIFSRDMPNTFGLKEWENNRPLDNGESAQTSMAIN